MLHHDNLDLHVDGAGELGLIDFQAPERGEFGRIRPLGPGA
jgi:hypothetical protein